MHYSINLSPQVDSLDGRNLADLVALWLADIGDTTTPLTHESYITQTTPILRWWTERGPALSWSLDLRTLRDCARWLNTAPAPRLGRPLGWHAQNDALRRLRQCLHWAFVRGYSPIDCSPWVPRPVAEKPRVRQRAQVSDLERLLRAATVGPAPDRDVALIAVLIGTGVRRAEAAAMDVEDVRLDADMSGTITVRHAKRVARATEDGRIVVVDRSTGRYLAQWMGLRPTQGPLWVRVRPYLGTYTNTRLSMDRISRVVARLAEEAGIGHIVEGPHDLRRQYATWVYSQNIDNPIAARLAGYQLGHSKPAMTDKYVLGVLEEELRLVVRSPLAGRPPIW